MWGGYLWFAATDDASFKISSFIEPLEYKKRNVKKERRDKIGSKEDIYYLNCVSTYKSGS